MIRGDRKEGGTTMNSHVNQEKRRKRWCSTIGYEVSIHDRLLISLVAVTTSVLEQHEHKLH